MAWLDATSPDVVCLQELKCEAAAFPRGLLEDRGWVISLVGQKSYNGVAIMARSSFETEQRALPGIDGNEARYIEAVIPDAGGVVRVASIYAPNGNPIGEAKFGRKLGWLDAMAVHARELLSYEEPLVLIGDWNVIPEPADAANPESWVRDALFHPDARARWRGLGNLGLWDAWRAVHGAGGGAPREGDTFWGYRSGAWRRGDGIRIDHALVSPQAADRLTGCGVDREPRGWERPSDHAPLWIELAAPAARR